MSRSSRWHNHCYRAFLTVDGRPFRPVISAASEEEAIGKAQEIAVEHRMADDVAVVVLGTRRLHPDAHADHPWRGLSVQYPEVA